MNEEVRINSRITSTRSYSRGGCGDGEPRGLHQETLSGSGRADSSSDEARIPLKVLYERWAQGSTTAVTADHLPVPRSKGYDAASLRRGRLETGPTNASSTGQGKSKQIRQ